MAEFLNRALSSEEAMALFIGAVMVISIWMIISDKLGENKKDKDINDEDD